MSVVKRTFRIIRYGPGNGKRRGPAYLEAAKPPSRLDRLGRSLGRNVGGVTGHQLLGSGLNRIRGSFGGGLTTASSERQCGNRRERGESNLLHANPLALFGA